MRIMEYKRRDVQKAIILALRNLGGTASRKDIKKEIAESEIDGLDYDKVHFRKKTKNGSYSPFLFDFNFGLKNLEIVGYVEPLQRGQDVILTDSGRSADLTNYPDELQNQKIGAYWNKKNTLRYEKNKAKQNNTEAKEIVESELGDSFELSEKQIKDWFEKQNSDLSETLIAKLRKTDPYQFEEMMEKLLNAMGYKGTNGQSVVTQKSIDGGIDGIINQDPLGLRTVYIQVKRYAENNVVGSPEINSFFGALRRKQADRGVFITTSSFTKDAKEAAKQLNIALVDGEMLTNLMIQYKVGVQVSQAYELYDIDDDFFEQ